MQSHASELMVWSYASAASGYGLFSVYLARLGYARNESVRALAVLVAAVLSSAWGVLGLAFSLTGQYGYLVAGEFLDILRYGAWYSFLVLFVGPRSGSVIGRTLATSAAVIVAGGLALQAARLAGFGAASIDLPRVVLFHALAMTIFAIVLLEQLLRNVTPDSRWNVKPIFLSLGGIFCFDLYLYSDALLFNSIDADLSGVRGLVHAAVIPLLVLSTSRGGTLLKKIRLSQYVVFHSTALMLIGIYLLMMALVAYIARFAGGDWGRAIQFVVLFAALVLLGALVLSGASRARLRVLVGKHFFRYRYDYRDEWLRFTKALSAQDSLHSMSEQVIRGLADMVESPAGSLWLRNSAKRRFMQIGRWNMPETDFEIDDEAPLCDFLGRKGWVVNIAEFGKFSSRYPGLTIPEFLLESGNTWLVIPLIAGNDLIGFVVLASSRAEIDIDWEVNDILKTAGRQAAGFLAQVLASDALLEARKFDAFNRMSAFVVHDLKNIVTQLTLLVKNAERHGDNPEFQRDMLMTVQNSVERMHQLMLQLREGESPVDAQVGVGLSEIAFRLQSSKKSLGREFEVEVVTPVMARGHKERIERVIGHVVQNALDATEVSGRVRVGVDRAGGRASVAISDTGHGMSGEFVRERLFKPFQTTKTYGMGIGAYESLQYVKSLGGDVQVVSEVGVGTTITLLFPLFEAAPELRSA